MADGCDPERLGEPGQRPAPRLSLAPISLALIQQGLLQRRIYSLIVCERARVCVLRVRQGKQGEERENEARQEGSVHWRPEIPLIRVHGREVLLFDMGFCLVWRLLKKKNKIANLQDSIF